MSAISDFAAAQANSNAAIDSAIQAVVALVARLNAEILALQNSPGTVTPEDQASLDSIQAHSLAVASQLAALDAIPLLPVPPAVVASAK